MGMCSNNISRRSFVAAAAGVAAAATMGGAALGAGVGQARADGEKVLTISVTSPSMSLDPIIAGDATSMGIISNCVEALFTYDADHQIQPGICETYEESDDHLTYTFHLRDAVWNNGDPVTADDFVYAWRRNASATGDASAFQYQIEMAAIKNQAAVLAGELPPEELGVSALDEKTIQIELEYPVSYLLDLLAFTPWVPVNQKFCEERGDKFGIGKDDILYCGPYILTEYSADNNRMTLSKNPDYWDAANVQVDKVVYQVIADTQQAVMSYENGDVDYVELTGDLVAAYADNPAFSQVPGIYNYYLMFNVKVDGYESQSLRQAIAYAIDRESLCNDVLKDGSIPAYNMTMKGLAFNEEGKDYTEECGQFFEYDPEKAMELWEAAQAETDRREITITYDQEKDFAANACTFIQALLEATLPGLTVNIVSTPKKNRLQIEQDHDFEICFHGWGPDYADATAILAMYYSTHPSNYSQWASEEFDALYDQANSTDAGDPAARWEDLKRCNDILTESAVCPPLFQTGSATLTRENVHGLSNHLTGIKCFYKFVTVD